MASVRFELPPELDERLLRPAFEGELGRVVEASALCRIRDVATDLLTRQGYVADVRIPPQDLASGNIRMRAVVARLAAVSVRGNAHGGESTIARILGPLQGQILNLNAIEEKLGLIDDLSGYEVTLSLHALPGREEDELGALVTLHFKPVELAIAIDNRDETYPATGLATVDINGLIPGVSRTSLGVYRSADPHSLQGFSIGEEYRGPGSLHATARLTHVLTREKDLGIGTASWFGTGELQVPVVQARNDLRVALGFEYFDYSASLDAIPLFEDRSRVAFATIAWERRGYRFADDGLATMPLWEASASVQLRRGLAILGATDKCFPIEDCIIGVPPSRLEGDPTATVLRAHGHFRWLFERRLSLSVTAAAQYTKVPLLTEEEYVGGNFTIGRGYGATALRGDQAAALQFEGQYGTIIDRNQSLAAYGFLFVDAVKIHNLDRLSVLASEAVAVSTGAGLRLSIAHRFGGELLVAVPMTRGPILEQVEHKPQWLGTAYYAF